MNFTTLEIILGGLCLLITSLHVTYYKWVTKSSKKRDVDEAKSEKKLDEENQYNYFILKVLIHFFSENTKDQDGERFNKKFFKYCAKHLETSDLFKDKYHMLISFLIDHCRSIESEEEQKVFLSSSVGRLLHSENHTRQIIEKSTGEPAPKEFSLSLLKSILIDNIHDEHLPSIDELPNYREWYSSSESKGSFLFMEKIKSLK